MFALIGVSHLVKFRYFFHRTQTMSQQALLAETADAKSRKKNKKSIQQTLK